MLIQGINSLLTNQNYHNLYESKNEVSLLEGLFKPYIMQVPFIFHISTVIKRKPPAPNPQHLPPGRPACHSLMMTIQKVGEEIYKY